MHSTPASLLERLRQADDQAAWERFVQLYTPLLTQWAGRLGLRGQDADDLVQDVLTLLIQQLPRFRYDPAQRFRSWLWTVTLNKYRERGRRVRPVTHTAVAAVEQKAGPDTTVSVDDAEYQDYLVKRALELMRAEFQPATWQAFWECVVADRPAAEVASTFGLTENAVYLAKGRVLRRLRRELEGLLD